MKINSLRYIVTSIIAIFVTVGVVNATGVFYFDSTSNQFVLQGNLKILEPGDFKLLLSELNSTDDSDLYINGKKDIQLRFGMDGTATTKFKINNGDNTEVLNITDNGEFKVGTNVTVNPGVTLSANGNVQVASTSAIMGSSTLTLQADNVGQKVIMNAGSVLFPQVDGTGNNIYFSNGVIGNVENLFITNITASTLNAGGGAVTIGTNLHMYDPANITWTGADNVINTAVFGHSLSGFVWRTWQPVARMRLDANGDLVIAGDLFTSASGTVKKFNRTTKVFE